MEMVPYHGNPGNACALACYTMIGQYLLPETGISFESFGKIADWHKGYVVWAFPIWKWLMDKGIKIHAQDICDLNSWATEGITGLENSVSDEEFQYYKENTYDLEKVTEDLRLVYQHPNFTFEQTRVTWETIKAEISKPGICDVTLDGHKLHRVKGFSIHRVVLIEIDETSNEIVFHDPNEDYSGAYTKETIDHFKLAIQTLSGPELVRYHKS